MRKVILFGKNIPVSCDYCIHSDIRNKCQFCTINKVLKNGKCRKFSYNPIMRIPKRQNMLPTYNAEDFII